MKTRRLILNLSILCGFNISRKTLRKYKSTNIKIRKLNRLKLGEIRQLDNNFLEAKNKMLMLYPNICGSITNEIIFERFKSLSPIFSGMVYEYDDKNRLFFTFIPRYQLKISVDECVC